MNSHIIHIISDGTGRTAEQIVKAALVQFEGVQVKIIIHSNVQKKEELKKIFDSIVCDQCMIVHTVVSNELRNEIIQNGKIFNMNSIDLMGPLLSQISSHLSIHPAEKPGVFHELNKAYFQRIDAIEFAIKHDDGQRAEELDQADIVLLGVSRTFKTPLSIYLANLGWKTGNFPLVLDFELPAFFSKIPSVKIFGLTTEPLRLATLRQARDNYLNHGTGNYSTLEQTKKELNYANGIFQRFPNWHIIDVTNKPLEEIASNILSKIKKEYVTDFNK